MSELALPSAGKGEFARLNDALTEVQRLLDGDEVSIEAHATAAALLAQVRPRAAVFEGRAKEKDEDKQLYGPKMVQRVLDFCAALAAADEREAAVDASLATARTDRAAAATAAAVAEVAAAAAAAEAERVAEAERAAVAALAEEEARLAAEAEAERHAAAIEAPLFGGGTTAPAAADVEMDEMGRRPLVSGLDLDGALELLASRCTPAELTEALQALQLLCVNVAAHPEDSTFRTVRLLNGHFQSAVARHPGGVEALLALGFGETEDLGEEPAVVYVMEEPSLEDDYEGWADWFDGVKRDRDTLLAVMHARAIRPLPPATKGIGWNDAAPQRPAEMSECLTLHGQRGGGL